MSEWSEMSISELALGGSRGVAGGPFGSSLGRKDYVADGVPVIRGAQLANGSRFTLSDAVFVSENKADRHRGNLAYPNDVLVTQRGTLGQVGLIPNTLGYERYLLSQSQMRITADTSICDPAFLYFALGERGNQRRLIDHGMTAGVPHINLATLRAFTLDVPSISTQRRIAAVLSAFDELIEINERRIELLEDLARSLYREWFVHFRFPGHEAVEFVHSELGPIPESWEIRRLGDVSINLDRHRRPISRMERAQRSGAHPYHAERRVMPMAAGR